MRARDASDDRGRRARRGRAGRDRTARRSGAQLRVAPTPSFKVAQEALDGPFCGSCPSHHHDRRAVVFARAHRGQCHRRPARGLRSACDLHDREHRTRSGGAERSRRRRSPCARLHCGARAGAAASASGRARDRPEHPDPSAPLRGAARRAGDFRQPRPRDLPREHRAARPTRTRHRDSRRARADRDALRRDRPQDRGRGADR